MTFIKRNLAVLLLTTLIICSACSRETGTTAESGHWKIKLDDSWSETEPLGDPWTLAYENNDGVTLQIAGVFSDDILSRSALSRLDLPAMTNLVDYEVESVQELDIEDASDAVTQRVTYSDSGEPAEAVWIIASQWPYPETAALALSGKSVPQSTVDELIVNLDFVTTTG